MGPNLEAFDALVDRRRSADALLVPGPLVELGRSLAADMDDGEGVSCPKCKTVVHVGHNAALVKQYRDVVAEVAGDDGRKSPVDDLLAELRDAASPGAAEQR
jgi:Ni,Fe-hydrogenase III small subunit